MLTVSVTEAKNKLSALLARVKAGETVVITERGIPVARVEPAVSAASEDDEARLAGSSARGSSSGAQASRSSLEIFEQRPPAGGRKSIVDTLLEERQEGR